MLQDNLIVLRNMHGMSQEGIAEKIGISRQAYAKWESGATVPDIDKCKRLADFYDVTIDSLLKTETEDKIGMIPPAPKGKNICSSGAFNQAGASFTYNCHYAEKRKRYKKRKAKSRIYKRYNF